MNKLISILSAGDRPWTGIYLRILAFAYLTGTVIRFSNMFGMGDTPLEEMTSASKTADLIFAQFGAITMVGLWLRRPWGIACFFAVALSQLVLYWGFPELFVNMNAQEAPFQSLINFHLSTLGIFFMLQIKGK